MSWFRKKGKYWYFVERVNGEEKQYYIGDDEAVKKRLIESEPFDDLHEYFNKIWKELFPDQDMTSPSLRSATEKIIKKIKEILPNKKG